MSLVWCPLYCKFSYTNKLSRLVWNKTLGSIAIATRGPVVITTGVFNSSIKRRFPLQSYAFAARHLSIVIATQGQVVFETDFWSQHPEKTKCYLCKKKQTFWPSFAAETTGHHKSIVITTQGQVVFGTDFLSDHPGKGFLCNKCYLCNKIPCEFSCSNSNKSWEHCYRDTLSLEDFPLQHPEGFSLQQDICHHKFKRYTAKC